MKNLFDKGCLVKLETSCWTARTRIPPRTLLEGVHNDVDARFIGAHKKLVDSDALRRLESLRVTARKWLYSRSLPFPLDGVVFIPSSSIPEIDAGLKEYQEKYHRAADDFAAEYADLRKSARVKLGSLYDEADYPAAVRNKFAFDWRFLSISPASESQLLSPEIVQREQKKFQELMAQAAQEAVTALRVRFAELIDHMVEKLTGGREGGRPKIFRESLVTNIREFLDGFADLNVLDDRALAELVEKARAQIAGVDAEGLRDDAALRHHVASKMEEVQRALDEMMVERPTRRLLISAPEHQTGTELQP